MNKYAIVVSYEPDVIALKKLCNSIIKQGFYVILVDNSENVVLEKSFNIENCIIIANGENLGIAYAQNIGIKYAISKGAKIITFFDQDSVITDGILSKLSYPVEKNKLCITCPVSIDKLSGMEYPSHVIGRYGWPSDIYSKGMTTLIPVDIAISSGMTTSSGVFEQIGLFDEDFFIDFVDIEWCLRSKTKGIQIYVVPEAVIEHSVGDRTISIGPITIVKHSPARTYYKVRNSMLLFKKKVNILFAIRQVLPALIHNLFLLFIVDNKTEYLSFYIKGVYHGVIGHTGKYQERKK